MKLPLALTLASLAGLFAFVETGLEAAEPADYVRDVKPLLAKHCVTCHGATKPRAGLRLDTVVKQVGKAMRLV